ncbi:DUF4245 family protein [Microbacterium sp. ARD31]|jgi:hypothetical protein|uniref:DUF4245 family protein n=1 Tax=Microbacterium sp. ARD31 TaxID=2962576 RepID=UPI0028816FE7|nr:DUF4245 family protein [Microbacterium sp. ARD31]MDT0180051.1 DUF4245 family protein [Microbacterium sp. ARD31]
MARDPRIVAELGRPETPDETAARKAEASRIYRSSQTVRNLVAALVITVAVVAVIIFAVPRGTPPDDGPIDVAAVAADVADARERTVIVPDAPPQWRVNAASVTGEGIRAWTVVYVPDAGFLRIAQGFDADESWPTRELGGAAVGETVEIAGVEWDRYDIRDPARAGNVSGALATDAGADIVMVYGTSSDEDLERAAEAVAEDVLALREEES